jgi:DNA-binding CsgD family transcriptional regulator
MYTRIKTSARKIGNEIKMINKVQKNYNLSSRECQCLTLWSKGFSMRTIGTNLEISPRTVEMHIARIKKKMNVRYKEEVLELVHHGV